MTRNQKILAEVNKKIKGQLLAKKILINLANKSYLRYYQRHGLLLPAEQCIDKHNALLIGESGSGKTYLVKTLSKIMDFPLFAVDATSLGPTCNSDGISPKQFTKDLLTFVRDLMETYPARYQSTAGALDQVIIFIDEIDKLAHSFDSSGNWNKHVQSNFLNIIDTRHDDNQMSFILAGAFVGLNKDAESIKDIGFVNSIMNSCKADDYNEKVIKFGLIPELVGRIHHIVVYDKYTYKDYLEILTDFLIPSYKKTLVHYGYKNYKFKKDFKDSIIKKAMKSQEGIRRLEKELAAFIVELEFQNDCKYMHPAL